MRDATGVRQGLRMAAVTLSDQEAEEMTRLLVKNLDPVARFWLANLLGPRVEPGQPLARSR